MGLAMDGSRRVSIVETRRRRRAAWRPCDVTKRHWTQMTVEKGHSIAGDTARKATPMRHGGIMRSERKATMIAMAVAFVMMAMPMPAFAASSGGGDAPMFSSMISTVTGLVNMFLPIAILIAGWKIIYLLIFPGLLGSDPFNQVPDGYSLQWDAIWTLIKYRLTGFFKGLLWIGGIWLLFNGIVGFVSVLASNLAIVL